MKIDDKKSNPRDRRGSVSSITNSKISKIASGISQRASVSRKAALLVNGRYTDYVEGASGELLPDFKKAADDFHSIILALNNHFIFTSLTEEDKEIIADTMQLYAFMPQKIIFKQGMPSRSYYIVKTGSVEVVVNGRKVNKLGVGEAFGELALLHDNNRSATIKTLEFTTLWVLEREIFKKVIEDISVQVFEQNREFIEHIDLLRSLSTYEKDCLASNLVSVKYNSGKIIFSDGDKGDQLFIIKEGVVSVKTGSTEIRKLYPGAYFGEENLIGNDSRTSTCSALTSTKCVCLSKEMLANTLNYSLVDIIEKNTIMEAINRSERLSKLSNYQKECIISNLTLTIFNPGDVVIPINTPYSSKIYIIITGRLVYSKTCFLLANKGSCIGDMFIGGRNDLRFHDDIIAECDTKIGELTKYQLEASLGGIYDEIIKQNAALNILKRVSLFNELEDDQLKYLLSIIQVKKILKDAIILREGEKSSTLFIVKKGKVDVYWQGKLIKSITRLGYFSERCTILNYSSNYTYVTTDTVRLWVIGHLEFDKIVTQKMKELAKQRVFIEDEEIDLDNITIIDQIGKGIFARVYLARSSEGRCYALKTYSRRKILKFTINQQILVLFI